MTCFVLKAPLNLKPTNLYCDCLHSTNYFCHSRYQILLLSLSCEPLIVSYNRAGKLFFYLIYGLLNKEMSLAYLYRYIVWNWHIQYICERTILSWDGPRCALRSDDWWEWMDEKTCGFEMADVRPKSRTKMAWGKWVVNCNCVYTGLWPDFLCTNHHHHYAGLSTVRIGPIHFQARRRTRWSKLTLVLCLFCVISSLVILVSAFVSLRC